MQTDLLARANALAASQQAAKLIRLQVASALFAKLAIAETDYSHSSEGVNPNEVQKKRAAWCWHSAGLLVEAAGLA